ncbi:MAG: 50S ribosomal protein L15 [Ruminococcaceae bacterium]|nr:50S ribosomal protein L15 [Oscillospiraceae bacterium]
MKLEDLRPEAGSRQDRYRKGRGHGSGNGKTAGKGHKGQNARSGGGVRPGFEGGQTPLYRRMPKRGFNNKNFTTTYAVVNVDALNVFEDGATVNALALQEAGLINDLYDGVKILGNGELTKKLNVEAAAYTKSASEKIEKLGGKAQVI